MIKKLFQKFNTGKEKEDQPRPPEPEYFDPPPPDAKDVTREVLKNPVAQVLIGLLLIMLIGYFTFGGSGKKEKKKTVSPIEKREVVTVRSMERAIDASVKSKRDRSRRVNQRTQVKKERKYNSDIAVFVAEPERKEKEGLERKKKEKIKLGLPSGTKIPALIPNTIFSFNVAAPVIAVTAKDFKYKEKVVVPANTEFLCEAQVIKSVDRINARCDLMVLPTGEEIKVRGLVLDEAGVAGVKGRVDRHTDRRVLKAIGESLLAGTSLFVGGRGTSSEPFALQDQFRLNLAQNLTNEAQRDLRAAKIEKSITTEPNTRIQVILLEAV